MKSFEIKYQTSELVPAPYAHAIEISAKINELNTLTYTYEITYLGREELTEEEIYEEGFTNEDDLKISGELSSVWVEHFNFIITSTTKLTIKELKEDQDFWEISLEKDSFYPKNVKAWKTVVEEFQQAVFEQNEFEKPLEITICRPDNELNKKIIVKGSFETRTITIHKNIVVNAEWKDLNLFLKNVFSGDYLYEKSTTTMPNKTGIYVNLGDEYWFEVGKSVIIQPSKITAWVDSL